MATGSKAGLYQNALSDSYLPLTTAQKPKKSFEISDISTQFYNF